MVSVELSHCSYTSQVAVMDVHQGSYPREMLNA